MRELNDVDLESNQKCTLPRYCVRFNQDFLFVRNLHLNPSSGTILVITQSHLLRNVHVYNNEEFPMI